MPHLHILVEGQTEEVVVREVISPYFTSANTWVTWSIHKTRRPAVGPAGKGGLSRWPKLYQEMQRLLRDSSITLLTTVFDYYAFPDDAPGMRNQSRRSPYDGVRHVEHALSEALGDRRFLPNLALHEIEAWVLADCARLGEVMGDPDCAADLSRIVREASGPELVDDGRDTAPSKRILNAFPRYRKTIDGPLVIADAGLDYIRKSCPHMDRWLKNIEMKLLH